MKTSAELLEDRNSKAREVEAKLRVLRNKHEQIYDILRNAVFDAARGGNVTCKNAMREILRLK